MWSLDSFVATVVQIINQAMFIKEQSTQGLPGTDSVLLLVVVVLLFLLLLLRFISFRVRENEWWGAEGVVYLQA